MSVVTGEAVNRCLPLVVAVHAEPHGVLDRSLRDRLLAYVAVAGGTLDLLANVRRMVEPDVILVREAVHTLPGQVQSLVPHRRDLLDPRSIRRDRLVAD